MTWLKIQFIWGVYSILKWKNKKKNGGIVQKKSQKKYKSQDFKSPQKSLCIMNSCMFMQLVLPFT